MKYPDHIAEAKKIGDDSWELINFLELPDSASADEQIAALEADHQWQVDHISEIGAAIDRLTRKINDLPDYGPDRSNCAECSATHYDHDGGGHFGECSQFSVQPVLDTQAKP